MRLLESGGGGGECNIVYIKILLINKNNNNISMAHTSNIISGGYIDVYDALAISRHIIVIILKTMIKANPTYIAH